MVTAHRRVVTKDELKQLILDILQRQGLAPTRLLAAAQEQSGVQEQAVLNALWSLLDQNRIELTSQRMLQLTAPVNEPAVVTPEAAAR